jgi:DNA-binding NarL/FixJ family response regulator
MSANNGGAAIRVLVAAASTVQRTNLEAAVSAEASFKLVGSVSTAAGLLTPVRQLQPDLVLVDLPGDNPQFPTVAGTLAQSGVGIVVLVNEPDPDWSARVLQAGIQALLPRDSSAVEIQSAIRLTRAGMALLDSELIHELLGRKRASSSDGSLELVEELTAREIEVLDMMSEGLANKEIAARLSISDHTVKFHISSILAKLGASSRTEAVTMGIRRGLVLI